ncbi:THUMP domain protein [Aspergillus sp. HF37]|nr:THUMP domain protein [Aspergillus sp. HF37]
MAQSDSAHASKKKKGNPNWRKSQGGRTSIESGDSGVFVTCDIGKEGKCIAETLDLFSQSLEAAGSGENEQEASPDEDDIEAQIKREVEGLKPGSDKSRQFQAVRMDIPCVIFVRLDKSIDPVQLVHQLCIDAQAHPETKRSRWIKRMTPATSIRKTLSVDLEALAREMLHPHFHSGGPSKKYAIRPSVRGNDKFHRDSIIQTVAGVVGPEHRVDLKNYDAVILVDVIQNVIGITVLGSDYDQLKRFNLAELYKPASEPQAAGS